MRIGHVSMKITLFLGAGASKVYKFPDTKDFKTNLEKQLDPHTDGLMLSMLTESQHTDIENILSDLEAIKKLPSNNGWQLLQKIEGPVHFPNTDKSFDQVLTEYENYRQIIHNSVYQEYCWKSEITHEMLKQQYDKVFNVLRDSDDGIHICTTNYDQIMEHYIDAPTNDYFRIDGFALDRKTQKVFFDPLNFNMINIDDSKQIPCYLYKLHGSLNWVPYYWEGVVKIYRREPEDHHGDNFVIYPTLVKKKEEYHNEPYSFLMEKFQERIDNSDIFIVIGYSFRDEQINEYFKQFLNKDHARMFVISPTAEVDTRYICEDKNKSSSILYADEAERHYIVEFLSWYEIHTHDTPDPKEITQKLESVVPDFFDEKIKVINFVDRLEESYSMFELIQIYIQICNEDSLSD